MPETWTDTEAFIINTVSAKINLDAYLELLTLDGTLVNVGAPAEPLSLSVIGIKHESTKTTDKVACCLSWGWE